MSRTGIFSNLSPKNEDAVGRQKKSAFNITMKSKTYFFFEKKMKGDFYEEI